MGLSDDVWQAVKDRLPRKHHMPVAIDLVQLFEDAGVDDDPVYGPGSLYEAAGLDDTDEDEDDEEVEEL